MHLYNYFIWVNIVPWPKINKLQLLHKMQFYVNAFSKRRVTYLSRHLNWALKSLIPHFLNIFKNISLIILPSNSKNTLCCYSFGNFDYDLAYYSHCHVHCYFTTFDPHGSFNHVLHHSTTLGLLIYDGTID